MVLVSYRQDFVIEITGSGSLAHELKSYYDGISVDSTKTGIDIKCEVGELDLNPDKILGKPMNYYGRNGDWFLILDKYKKIRVNKDFSHIHFSPEVPRAWAFKLLEYFVRKKLAHDGLTLIHASGAKVGDTTIVFPAWRHTGKTNTLISLIEKYNADYLSDDRLWLGKDGTTYGFPLPINLQPYNYNAFPTIDTPTKFYDQRYRLSNKIRSNTSDTGSFFSQALYFANEFYISPPSQKIQIEDLYDDVDFVKESTLDVLVCLQTVESNSNTVELTKTTQHKATMYLQSISDYEWNSMIREHMNAFNLLFNEKEALSGLDELVQNEREIWADVVNQTDVYILTVPREENWRKQNLSNKVVDELDPILNN